MPEVGCNKLHDILSTDVVCEKNLAGEKETKSHGSFEQKCNVICYKKSHCSMSLEWPLDESEATPVYEDTFEL